jgi:hypothetical protein
LKTSLAFDLTFKGETTKEYHFKIKGKTLRIYSSDKLSFEGNTLKDSTLLITPPTLDSHKLITLKSKLSFAGKALRLYTSDHISSSRLHFEWKELQK